MHLPTFFSSCLLLTTTTASLIPPSPQGSPSTASADDNQHIGTLNPRLTWDDIVQDAKSLYSQAMATPTTTIEAPSSSSSTSATAAVHGDLQEGDEYNNNTQFKGGKGWKGGKGGGNSNNGCLGCSSKGSNVLERPGVLAGAGLGLVVFLGLFA